MAASSSSGNLSMWIKAELAERHSATQSKVQPILDFAVAHRCSQTVFHASPGSPVLVRDEARAASQGVRGHKLAVDYGVILAQCGACC